jgi:hypothetical protein
VKPFLSDVRARLASPAALIVVHFFVSILALVSLSLIEWILKIMRIDGEIIPGSHLTLGRWILYLEIVASSVIIIAGTVEALIVLFLGIVLDGVTRIREIRKAWRSSPP